MKGEIIALFEMPVRRKRLRSPTARPGVLSRSCGQDPGDSASMHQPFMVLYLQGVERMGTRCAQRRHRARQQSHDENHQRDRAVSARIASAHPEELR